MLVGIAVSLGQGKILAQCLCLEPHILIGHLSPLPCRQAIGTTVEHLGGDAAIELAHPVEDTSRLGSLLLAERLLAERQGVRLHHVDVDRGGVPCHVEEERDGILHGFQVAHVEHPQFLHPTLIGQGELFPHVL